MKNITLLIFLFVVSIGYSQNQIVNGSFDNGRTNWVFTAPGDVVGGEAVFSSSNATGNPWDTELKQTGKSFTGGVSYTLTFRARASANRNISVNIQNTNVWTDQFRNDNVALTSTMTTYSYDFVATSTNANAQLNFHMGNFGSQAAAIAVYIDDVSIIPFVSPVNDVTGDVYINDGTFAAGDFTTAAGQNIATNDGSAAEPFATLDYALARSTQAPGDVIYIDAGTYSWASTHALTDSGTLVNPITIQGKGNNETNITTTATSTTSAGLHFTTGEHWVVKDLNWTSTAARAVWVDGVAGITVDNCTINMTSPSTELQSIIINNAAGELTIKNSRLTRSNTAFHMVEVVAGTTLIMQDNTSSFNALAAVGTASSVKITPNTSSVFIIERNKFSNGGYGIHFNAGVPATVASASSIIKNNFFKTYWGLINQSITDLTVHNNSFYTNGESIYGITNGFLTNWDIRNNILYTYGASKTCILSGSATSHPAVMDYNHYYSPNNGGAAKQGTSATILSFTQWQNAAGGPWEANGQGGNAASFDPLYVDAANGDLHLQPGSPAIGAGVDVGITDDIDGDARPLSGSFDMGADEYTVTVSSVATLSDLKVNGVSISGFNSATTNYTVVANPITSIPQITLATPTSNLVTSTVVTQATSLFEDATVVVTAEDGTTTQTYRVTIGAFNNTIIQDFEDTGSTVVTPPGLVGDNGTIASLITSPGGITGSSLSLESTSGSGTQTYQAGFFDQVSDLVVLTPVTNIVNVDVFSSSTQDFHLILKLEGVGTPIQKTQTYHGSAANTWQTLTYDFGTVNASYSKIVFFLNGDSTDNGFVGPTDFTAVIDNISTASIQTSPLAYMYQTGSWTPSDPVNTAASFDNVTIIDGTATLSGSLAVNSLNIGSGASLNANNGNITVNGNLVNNGAITGTGQLILTDDNADISGIGSITNLTVGATSTTTVSGSQSIINQLDILSGGTLQTGGNITMVSNAMGTARIDEFDAGAIIGNMNVERYIPAGNRSYRFMGPVVNGASVFDSWQEAGNNAAGFGTHITGTVGTVGTNNATTGHDETLTGANSMLKWNTASQAFTPVTNTKTEILNAGDYYLLFIRGDRTTDLSSNTAAITATTLRSSGSLLQNSLIINPGTSANDFFAVANPYQSKVNMETTATGTTDFIYYWDPSAGANGAYSTIQLSSPNAGTTGAATRVLDPSQAVFFQDVAGGATVTVSQSDKVAGNNNAVVFGANNSQQILRLKLYETARFNNNQSEDDGLYIDFDTAHNLNIDRKDATKLNGLNTNIAISKSTGEMLAIESRTLPTSLESVNLNISNYLTSNYTMVATVDALPGMSAYLKDNLNGNMTELVQGTSTSVNFTVDSNNALSTDASRFEIIFDQVVLSNEDTAVVNDTNVYPNPVSGDVLYISSESVLDGNVEVSLFNTLGQKVISREYDGTLNGVITLNNLSGIPSGLYILTINNGTNTISKKIILE